MKGSAAGEYNKTERGDAPVWRVPFFLFFFCKLSIPQDDAVSIVLARTVTRKDEDTFDKSPNPHGKGSDAAGEKPACQAHNELYNGLGVKAQVEVVNAQAAEDDAEKACRKPALLGIAGRRYIVLLVIGRSVGLLVLG